MAQFNKIYKYYGPSNEYGYIYSELIEKENPHFIYHMISIQNGIPELLDTGNTISTIQNKSIKLESCPTEGIDYEQFLAYKNLAEKKKYLSKKINRNHIPKSRINHQGYRQPTYRKNRT